MTFGQNYSDRGKAKEVDHWELTRFASCLSVVGGASRLFSALVKVTGAKSVTSYSDNRLFLGGTYKILGFSRSSVTPPSYDYIDKTGHSRLRKSNFQRKHLEKLLGSAFDPAKSERENAELAGYYQIHNCGLTRWDWRA